VSAVLGLGVKSECFGRSDVSTLRCSDGEASGKIPGEAGGVNAFLGTLGLT
jgi:hypothetical protein